ncbi:MAG: glycosyltransferase family 39 protein [Tepidisphaeraceae bacterium]
MSDGPALSRWRWIDGALLVFVLLTAGAIRIAFAGTPPSMDELWHLALSTGRGSPMSAAGQVVLTTTAIDVTSLEGAPPIYAVWTHMAGVLHPPLYVQALRLWRDVVGPGDVAAQMFSVAWYLVALGFGFAAIRLCFDRIVATLSMLLLAVAPVQIYLALEVRGYAMMIALTSIALWLMARCEVLGPTRRRALVLGLMPLPLMLTHYFAFGVCLAIGLYALIRFRGRLLAWSIGAMALSAILYAIVWLPFSLDQLHDIGSGDEFAKAPGLTFWERSLGQALAGPYMLLIDREFMRQPLMMLTMVVYWLPIILRRRAPRLLPWWLVGTCVMGTLLLLDATRGTAHLQFARYPSAASVALPPLLVLCIAAFRPRAAWAVGGALVIAVACFMRDPIRYDSPEFVAITWPVSARLKPGEPIIAVNHGEPKWFADAMLLHILHERGVEPRTTLKLPHPATRDELVQLRGATKDYGTAWLISGTPKLSVTDAMPEGTTVLESIQDAHFGTAYRIALPRD